MSTQYRSPSETRAPRPPARGRWHVPAALLVGGAVSWALPQDSGAPVRPGVDVDGARAALEKWVETRRVISDERRDWALGKEVLQDRIALRKGEIEALEKKIAEAEASVAEADRKRAELVAQNESLQQTSGALAGTVNALEARTLQLLARVPEPVRTRVELLSRRIPPAGSETKLSLGERFQNVVGILNEVDKFNRDISVTSEVRALPDGTSAEVTTLYLGLGQAYYAGASGKVAGTGTGTDSGWVWTPADAAASDIRKAIAILANEDVAAFVKLPLQVR